MKGVRRLKEASSLWSHLSRALKKSGNELCAIWRKGKVMHKGHGVGLRRHGGQSGVRECRK